MRATKFAFLLALTTVALSVAQVSSCLAQNEPLANLARFKIRMILTMFPQLQNEIRSGQLGPFNNNGRQQGQNQNFPNQVNPFQNQAPNQNNPFNPFGQQNGQNGQGQQNMPNGQDGQQNNSPFRNNFQNPLDNFQNQLPNNNQQNPLNNLQNPLNNLQNPLNNQQNPLNNFISPNGQQQASASTSSEQ